MRAGTIYILWDSSHIWGIMALRGMRALGLRARLVKSQAIAQQGALGKRGVSCLLAPGGSARARARALGTAGLRAVRAWVRAGGNYLGFCGGAGLALSYPEERDGLGLCPWTRASYQNRAHHLISGHVLAKWADGTCVPLPVWWPGRFAPSADGQVEWLAEYLAPGADLWLGDRPLATAPPTVISQWLGKDDSSVQAGFPQGQPLAIRGYHGGGAYILSYAHLETPASSHANALLVKLLASIYGLEAKRESVPQWDLTPPNPSHFFHTPQDSDGPAAFMAGAWQALAALIRQGAARGLFTPRTPWLWGWHAGLPGMACNNLLAAFAYMAQQEASEVALAFWRQERQRFAFLLGRLLNALERLILTRSFSESTPTGQARDKWKNLSVFGHPMEGGGIAGALLTIVEELIYLSEDC